MPDGQDKIVEFLQSIYPFRSLEEEDLVFIAGLLEHRHIPGGQVLYLEGTEADTLYLVWQGRVRLSRRVGDEERHVSALRSGDSFGFDALTPDRTHFSTAVVVTNTELLCISLEALAEILHQVPVLQQPLKMLADSYLLGLEVRLPWLGDDEALYFIARRHPFFFVKRMIGPLVWLILSLVFLLWNLAGPGNFTNWVLLGIGDLAFLGAWSLWNYVDWRNDYSIATNQRVLFQEKIAMLYDSRQEAPIHAILAVSTDSTQWGRMIGFGNVRVRTYAGLITLPDLENCKEVAALVEGEWFNVNVRRSRVERETIEEIIQQQFSPPGGQPPAAEGEPAPVESAEDAESLPIPAAVEPGFFQQLLANLFQIRFEKDGIITYRTHWFILVRRLFMPTLLLVGVFAMVFFRVVNVFTALSISSVMALGIVLFLLLFAWWVYQFVDWRNDYYVISQDQVLDVYRKPLGREERRAAPLRNIQSVEFERLGLLGLLLNFGTVYIRVGDTELTFDYVFNPSQVQQELFNRIAEREFREREEEIASEHQRLSEWFEIYDRVRRSKGRPAVRPRGQ